MTKLIKALGLFGMLWAIGLAVLGYFVSLAKGGFDLRFLGMAALLFLICWRLYHLRRWAGVAVCLHCGWVAATSPEAGIWMWTATWIAVTVAATGLVLGAWRNLRSGL